MSKEKVSLNAWNDVPLVTKFRLVTLGFEALLRILMKPPATPSREAELRPPMGYQAELGN